MSDTESRHFQCRHIFTDGHRCGSKCLRDQDFCYYHHGARKPKPAPDVYRDTHSSFELPVPEDRSAIQAGIGIILQRISSGRLDSKRAGLLLYALQIASLNLPKSQAVPQESVEEITLDEHNQSLAPINELIPPEKEKSLEEIVMEQFRMMAGADPEDLGAPSQIVPPFEVAVRPSRAQPISTTSFAIRKGSSSRAQQLIPCPHPDLGGGAAASPQAFRRRIRSSSVDKPIRRTNIRLMPAGPFNSAIRSLQAVATPPIARRRKAHPEGWAHPDICRRSPNLPHTYACSTIGPARLNFRVRDGNGCDPRGKLTGKL